jgi:hypothetical protein
MALDGRRRTGRSVIWIVAVVLLWGLSRTIDAESDLGPRVRSTNPIIAAAIVEGNLRSATFRSLVRAVEKTDGIVYVENGHCGHGVPACLSLSVVSGDGYRLLRILVDSARSVALLIASIGHELQHAIELLSEPAVRTMTAAYMYYLREAPTARDVFETAAAVRAEVAVAADLSHK